MALENRGIPSVFVASDEFVDAAQAQSVALGFTPAAVYVPHPIQDRTDQEMMNLAEGAYAEIMRSICTGK